MKGRLEKRAKSSWTIVIEAGRDHITGKRNRVYHSVKGTKTQAKQEMDKILAELQQGIYVRPDKTTVAEYLDYWLETACEPRLAETTVKLYRQCCNRHVIPAIGSLRLTDIEPRYVQGLYTEMLEAGVGKRMVQVTHVVLGSALKQAVKWQALQRNPAEYVEPPKPDRKPIITLQSDEVGTLLKAAKGSPIQNLILLALCTGMRKGELLALKWPDIDLPNGTINIQRGLVRVDGETVLRTPKTKTGIRCIPVDRYALEKLYSMKASSKSEFVFSREGGKPLDPSTVTHQFSRLAQNAGFPGLRFHDLRHTHASLLLAAGVHPKIVQERLGHSTISVTLDTYSHVTQTMQKDAADAISSIWRRNGDDRPVDLRHVQ